MENNPLPYEHASRASVLCQIKMVVDAYQGKRFYIDRKEVLILLDYYAKIILGRKTPETIK